ncbi:hypothetical protein Z947_2755 [Sulfitobacter geojensis]|nr:hypothetical protein Z947_2755 [Sulfitobacter geojensis]
MDADKLNAALTAFVLATLMKKTVSLILPVLIPSWRFFKAVEPSPRVQWAVGGAEQSQAADWQEYQPRPQTLSIGRMLQRLFWNPAWNDALFVVSCAERIALGRTTHSINEIETRVRRDIHAAGKGGQGGTFKFRLVFVHHDGGQRVEDVVFLSDPASVGDPI